ncbi:unnamed protein product [Durusdinium trenchii]|uniref:CPC1/SPEF2 domain-containing protein n=1 Tax=Durusdinium trenchii TaxID=1381693 RepID=A0ABP0S4X4_9DINO
MIESLREQEERERVRYRAVERLRHAKRREKLREEMEGILELIVQMSFASLQQEQLTDQEEVDCTLWREWVSLFEENLPVMSLPSLQLCAEEPAPLTALPEPTGLANLHAVGATLNSAALRDFMETKGQWKVPLTDEATEPEEVEEIPASQPPLEIFDCATEVAATLEEAQGISFASKLSSELDFVENLPVNYRFGVVVASMIDRKYKEPPPQPPPSMPEVPLRLVITGKPYAGKKTVARRLAEAYNLEIIDLDEVVRECLAASKPDDYTRERINRPGGWLGTQQSTRGWRGRKGLP